MLAGFALLVHSADLKSLNMKTISFRSNPLKVAFAGLLGAAAIISAPGQAQAANPITVLTPAADAGIYSIAYVNGTYTSVAGILPGQPWWSNSNLATTLAQALGNSPTPTSPSLVPGGSFVGNATFTDALGNTKTNPNLLFATNTGLFGGVIPTIGGNTSQAPFTMATSWLLLQSDSTAYNWAIATRAPLPTAPTPGPLPLVGAAAAFGFSRRLRSRINKSAKA